MNRLQSEILHIRQRGKIKFFIAHIHNQSAREGHFGFITVDNPNINEDVFFHFSRFNEETINPSILVPNLELEFNLEKTLKGYQAINIDIVPGQDI